MFIDEIPAGKKDLHKIGRGEESEVGRTLQCVSQYSALAWVSWSTSHLLETQGIILLGGFLAVQTWPFKTVWRMLPAFVPALITRVSTAVGRGPAPPIGMDSLTSHLSLYCPSYVLVELNKCMRSSGSIAAAAAPAAVKTYNTSLTSSALVSVLAPGTGSTVPGPRSLCVLARWSGYGFTIDYPTISRCLHHCLADLLPPSLLQGHIVILCGQNICPRQVAGLLPSYSPTLYEGGVKQYDTYNSPTPLPASQRTDQTAQLTQWLTGGGGLLVTHSAMFSGMECPGVIMIQQELGVQTGGRSGLLRAAAFLVVITDSATAQEEEIKTNFVISHI